MIHEKFEEPMKIVISGVESETYWRIVVGECEMKTVLMSYHYLQKKPKDFLAKRLKKHPDVKVFIDSGAHTFLANFDEYENKPMEFWDEYLSNYVKFIEDNKDYIFACADLDIDDAVGIEQVDEWRKNYFEPLEEKGVQVCYIWHSIRGDRGWEEMCRKYSYVGFSMENDKTATLQKIMKRINVAKKYNSRVHGMALTKTEVLSRVPFFSADSSVDGESSIVVKDLKNDRTFRTSIAELYNNNITEEFRTTDYETRVPYEDYQVLTVDNNNKIVWGDLYGVVKHKVKKATVKLKVEGGKDIICTTDHSIITMDKNGALKETSANDLKVGDFVMTPRSYKNQNELVPFTNVLIDKPNSQSGEKEWQVVELSDKYLQFLGLWVGDGHFSSDTTGLSCYQDKECKEVIDYVANVYKAKVSVDKNGVDARISNVRLQRVMKALGFNGTSKTKRVPRFIYSLSESQICQFLKGYFSADGTGSCECSTVSKELKNDLVELLNMLGIITSVSYTEPKPYDINGKKGQASEIWHLNIRNKLSKQIFKSKIGFLQDYKNKKLEDLINNTPDREPKCTGIPKTLATSSTIRTDATHTTSVVKWKGSRISRKYEGVFNPKVLNSEVLFLEIKSIEQVTDGTQEVEVYDLSVRDYERFFANGILVHNTTWLVGQQYGELNWFDGRKMKRLSKTEWRRNYKTKLLKEPFNADWDRLINGMGGQGDTYELLRLNVIAYKLAEQYLRKRLGSKMYWMSSGGNLNSTGHQIPKHRVSSPTEANKANITANTSIPSILTTFSRDNNVNYPPSGWFEGECKDYAEYCQEFNIDVDSYSKEEAINILYYFYILLEAPEEELAKEDSQDLIDYAKLLVDDSIETREDAIKELRIIFQQNLDGSKNDFNPNQNVQPRERRMYLKEEEFLVMDLSEQDIETAYQIESPKPEADMPEVEIYDEELKEKGIQVVRDNKGRFVKGQKKVKKPKDIYSKKYPKLNCDTCYKSGDCPEYKAGFICAYDKMLNRFDTRNYDDIVDAMTSIVNANLSRMQKAMLFETMDGGMPTAEVTGLIDQNMRLLEKMKALQDTAPKTILSQRRVIKEDGSEETVTEMSVNPQEGGILSKIFGASESKEESKKDTKIVEAEIIE